MEVGLSSAAFYGDLETEDAAALLREFPIDFGEVFLESFSEYTQGFGRLARERMGALPCRSIHAKGTQFEPDLFGSSARQREDAFGMLEGALQAGNALGAKYYVFHGPAAFRHELAPMQIAHIRERAPRAMALAAQYGIRFLWENVCWCSLTSPEDAAALKAAFPSMGFVLDIKQAFKGGQDPFRMLEAMGESLCHVHVLDWNEQGELCLPGQGVFDFYRLRRALEAAGYQGGILLEPYASQGRDREKLTRSIRYLKEIFL